MSDVNNIIIDVMSDYIKWISHKLRAIMLADTFLLTNATLNQLDTQTPTSLIS